MDGTAHIATSAPSRTARRAPEAWLLGGLLLLFVAGCVLLILSVMMDQDSLARQGRWLRGLAGLIALGSILLAATRRRRRAALEASSGEQATTRESAAPCVARKRGPRLAEQQEALGTLAGGIVHDFNNYLASMLGNLQLAQLDAEPDSPVWESLNAATGACRRAQDFAKQLQTFTKGGSPVRTPTPLAEVILDAVTRALRDTSVDYAFDVEADLAAANVDVRQIRQVLHNLTANACQALPGGGTLRITARNVELTPQSGLAVEPGRYVHLRFEDRGPGIPAGELERIFRPYYTTRKGHKGLGLATSYSIVHKHGGSLTVESTEGLGATFHVHLPAADAAARSTPVRPAAATTGGERILWLDDQAAIAEVAQRMLMRSGYAVDVCLDGADVCDLYARAREQGRRYDLLVLDLNVPGGMGGREALAHLRTLDPGVRAVACSGHLEDALLDDPASQGFCATLAKPFTRQDLASLLIEALQPGRASNAA